MARRTSTGSRRSRLRLAAVLAAIAVGIVAALAGGALADNTTPDGDNATPVAADPLAYGTVCINSTTNSGALVAISRNGSATGTNTFKNGATVTISVLSVSGTGLSASMGSPTTITLPSNWTSLTNNTMSDAVSSQVTLVAGSTAGSFTGSVTYRASGLNTSNSPITRDATMAVSATVSDTGACSPTPPDSTPPAVTVSFPSPVSGQNGWFNADDVTPVVGSVTASDDSNVSNISCTGATLSGVTGYGTNTASGTLTVSGDGTHNVSCTATDGASPANTGAASGSSNTATIKIDTNAPVITDAGFDSGTAGDNGWYVSAVTESFAASDPTSDLADCASTFTQTSSSDGSAVTIPSGPCSDKAGNTNPGISSAAYKIDTVAPTVSGAPTTDPNSNGWYKSNVTIHWTCSDTTSLVASCPADSTISTEGRNQTANSGLVYDNAGNSNSADSSPAVNIDKTAPNAPTVSSPTSADYGTNWYKDSVAVSFAGNGDPDLADASAGSGVASVTGSETFDSTNVNATTGYFTITGTATDNAANTSEGTTVSGYVDWQTPTASFSDCPATNVVKNSTGTLHWSASDAAPSSGLSTDASGMVALQTGTIGSHTLYSPAPADNVGHTGTAASCTYNVIYNFIGFLSPLNPDPTYVNMGNAGRTYPIKWQLTDGATPPNYITDAVPNTTIAVSKINCGTISTDTGDPIDYTSSGGTSLRYDSTANQYVYNWATPSTKNSCYRLTVTTPDGQPHVALFSLK